MQGILLIDSRANGSYICTPGDVDIAHAMFPPSFQGGGDLAACLCLWYLEAEDADAGFEAEDAGEPVGKLGSCWRKLGMASMVTNDRTAAIISTITVEVVLVKRRGV